MESEPTVRRMERVDMTRHNLTPQQRDMMEMFNKKQYEKFAQKHYWRKFGYLGLCSAVVFGVYGYTMYSMTKDNILADIEDEIQKRETMS